MEGATLGVPNEIWTILVIDAVIIGLYVAGALAQKKHLIGAKVMGTTFLVGSALLA